MYRKTILVLAVIVHRLKYAQMGQGPPRALALEATALGTRVVVWAVSVVSRGWAMPGAWVVLPAHTTPAWRREGLQLLRRLRPAVPQPGTVIVWADRGL